MSESATCPICHAPQTDGIACHNCLTKIETELRTVPSVVDDLAVALSKMARIGTPSGGGLARERNPINVGAMQAGDLLNDVLSAWALDVWTESPFPAGVTVRLGSLSAARIMLANINDVRRHPKVEQLRDEVADAMSQARRSVDRPQDRVYLGSCMVEQQNADDQWVTCLADVYANQDAAETRCRECGITHDVSERRAWMLRQAEDRLFTVREAAQIVAGVTESAIRGYLHRKRIAYRVGTRTFRLGDLLDVLVEQRTEKVS